MKTARPHTGNTDAMTPTTPTLVCRHRLPAPERAGCATLDALRARAKRYPHLRPCPRRKGARGSWQWIERARCATCPEARAREANHAMV